MKGLDWLGYKNLSQQNQLLWNLKYIVMLQDFFLWWEVQDLESLDSDQISLDN